MVFLIQSSKREVEGGGGLEKTQTKNNGTSNFDKQQNISTKI